jgi:guanine nucleotide-binding protein subunit alpha
MQDLAARYVWRSLGTLNDDESTKPERLTKGINLGSGESGKSTIVKQMKIIHLDGYTEDELYNYRPTVFKNLVECAKAVIAAMRQFDIDFSSEQNRVYANFLMEYAPESGPQAHIDPSIGVAVQSIWNDPAKTQLMDRQTEFYLMDSAE